jgi:hypothetical protein
MTPPERKAARPRPIRRIGEAAARAACLPFIGGAG